MWKCVNRKELGKHGLPPGPGSQEQELGAPAGGTAVRQTVKSLNRDTVPNAYIWCSLTKAANSGSLAYSSKILILS